MQTLMLNRYATDTFEDMELQWVGPTDRGQFIKCCCSKGFPESQKNTQDLYLYVLHIKPQHKIGKEQI